MPPAADTNAPTPANDDTQVLLDRAKAGRQSALDLLFGRHLTSLRQWARGRLPPWARRTTDTADLVQDVLLRLFGRIDHFDARGKGALAAYLRQSIHNRIRDEIRFVNRRTIVDIEDVRIPDMQPSPYEHAARAEDARRYRTALRRLAEGDQELIVGAVELGYNHEQLAVATGRPTADAARVGLHRALRRLADEMTRV